MNVSATIKKYGIEQAFRFLYKDPEKHLPELMDWADKFSKGDFSSQRAAIRKAIEDPSDPYYKFIRHMIQDVDPEVLTTIAVNFFLTRIWWAGRCRNRHGRNTAAISPLLGFHGRKNICRGWCVADASTKKRQQKKQKTPTP